MTVLWENEVIRKTAIEAAQINLGNRCNQRCSHCHIDASPNGNKNMDEKTAALILKKLIELSPKMVEFTGGAPEMNRNLKMLIEEISKHRIKTAIRTNLTVLDMPEYSDLIDLYKKYEVKVIASLPGCFKDITDKQRGKGVFEKSIAVLKRLNEAGYGKDLELDLVYNPSGSYLPPPAEELEYNYRLILKENYKVVFTKLITITNSPMVDLKSIY